MRRTTSWTDENTRAVQPFLLSVCRKVLRLALQEEELRQSQQQPEDEMDASSGPTSLSGQVESEIARVEDKTFHVCVVAMMKSGKPYETV
jgi:hypothetical protein